MQEHQYKIYFQRNFKKYENYNEFYNKLLDLDIHNLFNVLHKLRLPNGFYKASVSNDYSYSWLRDNFFCSLPELWNNTENYIQTYQTWLDYYKNIEEKYGKFTSLIKKKKIDFDWEFPNPRINTDLSEIHSGWNHIQIDQIGYFLYGISIGEINGLNIIRDTSDINIISTVIELLDAIDYHIEPESGAWEEGKENPRASTIGVIVAGLKSIKMCSSIDIEIPEYLIENGVTALNNILPNETPTRKYDLAQLFLIYPFNLLTTDMSKIILNNIEDNLLDEHGVYRYLDDKYYNHNGEATWLFGLSYLGLIYCQLGNKEKARYFYEKIVNESIDYEIPELYYHGTKTPNDNNPLSWSIAMTIELAHMLKK